MSSSPEQPPATNWSDRLEENIIALLLGVMTLITFANVAARYGFNSNIFYALEMTVFLFAWLVLLGASYAVKKNLHLGVDALVNLCSAPRQRLMALLSVGLCLLYSFFLLKAAWDYWAPFANLPPTDGRWFPLGLAKKYPAQGWYETNDIPVPFFLRWLETVFNEGMEYEKLPRLVPYLVLPLSAFLLCLRFAQAAGRVWRGRQSLLIVSHESEEEIANTAPSRQTL